jgi:hypothetical protein
MKTAVQVEGEITEDGHLLLDLPPELPKGRVVVTLEPLPEEEIDLTEDDLLGLGLTAEEIARSPEIGAWAGDHEVSGAEVRFEVDGTTVRIVREERSVTSRGQRLVEQMRGRATAGMSTEEIMALTRGEA